MAAKKKASTHPAPPPQEIPLGPETPFVLTALREDNPRDFLAALGLLRLLDLMWPDACPRMCWNKAGHPRLHLSASLPNDWTAILVSELQALNSHEPHPFVHNKIIKVSHSEFRAAIDRSLAFRDSESAVAALPCALYAAYGSQIHAKDESKASPSAFSFANAQSGKELLRDIRELISKNFTPAGLHEFLTCSPSGRRDGKSFRWHPAELRTAAYRAHDPGSKITGDVIHDYPESNILAFFGLSFYPVVDTEKRELTLGISRVRQLGDCFTWPVWETFHSCDSVFTLLHHPIIHADHADGAATMPLGISGAYRCIRMKVGKAPTISLYFSPASRTF